MPPRRSPPPKTPARRQLLERRVERRFRPALAVHARRARQEAEAFLAFTSTTADRTWQALAWEANARLALASLDLERAQDCITKALSAMEGYETPLAEWRVQAAAAELSELRGHSGAAKHHRELSRATVLRLAQSLPEDDPLRMTFLSTPPISTIVARARLVQGSG